MAFLTELDRASHPVIRTLISLNKMARREMEEEVAEVDSLNRVCRGDMVEEEYPKSSD